MIRAGGFSGIVGTIVADASSKKMHDRSSDGRRSDAMVRRLSNIVVRATSRVADANGKRSCIGPMIAESFKNPLKMPYAILYSVYGVLFLN